MPLISFNDTADYQHICILGTDGVFTAASIDLKTLPEGFYPYRVSGNSPGCIDYIQTPDCVAFEHVGYFVSKTELSLQADKPTPLSKSAVIHKDQPFSIEDYFGVKESIDLQIALADEKRRAQSDISHEPLSQHHGNNSFDTPERREDPDLL